MSDRPQIRRKIQQVFFFWIISISLFAVSLLTAYSLWIQYRNYNQAVGLLRQQYTSEQKLLLRDKVNEAIAFARFKAETTEVRLKKEIKARVDEAWSLANHLYLSNRDKRSLSDIKTLIKESLRPIRFNEGRGYYFIVSMDGVEELYPTRPELEGKNLWDLQDIHGNYVIRSEVEIVQSQGEGFVLGYWPNPMIVDDPGSLEYSYVKAFQPLDWLLGTGEFIDNVLEEVQQETLNWLQHIRYGNGSYIFVETFNGDALLMNGKPVSPSQNVWELEDPEGVKVIQEEIRIATDNADGGYLRYSWHEPNRNKTVPVLTYVKAINEWQWVVGSSIFLEDIEAGIAQQRKDLLSNVRTDIVWILAGYLGCLPLVFVAAYYFSRRFDREFRVFLTYFTGTKESADRIPVNTLTINEFNQLAEAANEMLERQHQAELQLKVLSTTDPLTGIANRREMESRIQDEASRSLRTGSTFAFILIDIDHFKSINDTYGHDVGDRVLQEVVQLFKGMVRRNDLLCRWGGEEFLILAPDTLLDGALQMAEKIRKAVEDYTFNKEGRPIQITLTGGVSQVPPGHCPDVAVTQADHNLLQGKRTGRNKIVPKPAKGGDV